jgi:site-specific DNA recombinase
MPNTNGHGFGDAAERVALYMRVSGEEQAERMTIGTQEEFLGQYAGLYGHEVAGVYKDEAVSGTVPMHERPEGRRLLEDAKADAFETVLVYKLDRIGRTLLVTVDAHDRLMGSGVALKSATEPIDTSSPAGRLIFQMLASFAEFERGTIRERTTHGLHRALRAGKHAGRVPYGYRLSPTQDGSSLEVVAEEAEIVREIIEGVAAGSTLYKESKRLNDQGVPAPGWRFKGERKHGTSWSPTTVRDIVHQGAYSGTHTVKINGGEGCIEREVPAIVEGALQQRAIARLAENKRYPNRKNDRNYLLRGIVRCEVCGFACTGRTSSARVSEGKRKYSYYGCISNRTDRANGVLPHRAPNVSAPWLEDLVWADVRRFIENPGEVLERVREQLADGDEAGELAARHADLTKRLAAKQAEKDRYVRLYAGGRISEEELDVYLLDLKHQADNLRLLIGSVEADLSRSAQDRLAAKSTEAWLLTLRERVEEVEGESEEAFSRRRELVKLLVERIDVGRNEEGRPKVEITYRFGPPGEEKGADEEFVAGLRTDRLTNSSTYGCHTIGGR